MWYNNYGIINAAWRPGLLPIPPSRIHALRDTPLRDYWTAFLFEQIQYPVFLTIQPNLAQGAYLAIKMATPASPEERVWAFLQTLFYHLDREITGCPRPQYLAPENRIQGWIVLEKLESNIHAHILVSCRSHMNQRWTALRLFELLDTVATEKKRPLDDAWAKETWNALTSRGWITDSARTRTVSPILGRYAPGGTAMVQLVQTEEDRRIVCRYMTKSLGSATLAGAYKDRFLAAKADLPVRELRVFHSDAGAKKLASCIRIDPKTRTMTLNLDDPHPWKRKGQTLR